VAQEDLAQARTRIEELEEQNADLQDRYTARSTEVEELTAQARNSTTQQAEQSKELSSLRNRLTLSQQNWLKEKEELVESEAYMREEFENAKQAMHDWEVLAMEERTIRKDLTDRVADLEEQLATTKEAYERAADERDTHSSAVDGLQKALQEIQTVRKQELKELVETNQTEQENLRKQLQDLQTTHASTAVEVEQLRKDLERALPFEKEVKEKNLLIGKLRHEAVILHDHLTKALRFLKKGKPEDNVDRYVQLRMMHFRGRISRYFAACLGDDYLRTWPSRQKDAQDCQKCFD
jgi:chromosome segregation ATPase